MGGTVGGGGGGVGGGGGEGQSRRWMPSERTMFFKRGILCFGYGRWERIYDCSQQLQDRFTLGLLICLIMIIRKKKKKKEKKRRRMNNKMNIVYFGYGSGFNFFLIFIFFCLFYRGSYQLWSKFDSKIC